LQHSKAINAKKSFGRSCILAGVNEPERREVGSMSETSCPDKRENCPLCRIKELMQRIAAAEAQNNSLQAQLASANNMLTDAWFKLEAAEARAERATELSDILSDESDKWVRELGEARTQLAAAEALLQRCKLTVLDADSELSAYGHGRPLDKPEALRISDACRSAYKEIVAWCERARAAGGGE
jgi:hypothetical protein